MKMQEAFSRISCMNTNHLLSCRFKVKKPPITILIRFIVEQISWAIFQGGGLWSTTFVSIYQNVRIGL